MATAAGDESPSSYSSSPCPSPSVSPKNRLKFLCSYGGKIVPRPSDGHLKYVGGHTRVLAVPRSISFSELKERIQGMFECCVAIKYQLVAEDLEDALVSVTCDDDLAHMLGEYDRLDALHASSLSPSPSPSPSPSSSSPRFRLFLFPSPSSSSVDAINNDAISPRSPVFTVSVSSSAATSPTSTIDGHAALLALRLNALLLGGGGGGGTHVTHRVRSAPNLGGGGGLQNQMANGAATPYHHPYPQQQHLLHRQKSSAAADGAATPHHLPHPQKHLLRRQKSSGAAYGAQAAGGGGGGDWRAGGLSGCGCRVSRTPQPPGRGRLHRRGGRCACFGHLDESFSSRPSGSSSPFQALFRKPLFWGQRP